MNLGGNWVIDFCGFKALSTVSMRMCIRVPVAKFEVVQTDGDGAVKVRVRVRLDVRLSVRLAELQATLSSAGLVKERGTRMNRWKGAEQQQSSIRQTQVKLGFAPLFPQPDHRCAMPLMRSTREVNKAIWTGITLR